MRYPADGSEAIEQVERLRMKGGEFLIRHASPAHFFSGIPS